MPTYGSTGMCVLWDLAVTVSVTSSVVLWTSCAVVREVLWPHARAHLQFHHGLQTRAESEYKILRQTETFDMIRYVYGNEAMSRAWCFEWHARFKSCRTSLNDERRCGWPSSSSTPKNVEIIRRLVYEDRRRSLNDISDPRDRRKSVPKSVKISISVPWMTQASCRVSSLGTRLGSTGTTRTPRAQHLNTTQESERVRSATKSMLVVFLTFAGLFTVNSSPGARLSTARSTAICWGVWGRTFGGKGLKCCARANECFTTTMHPLSELS